MSFIKAFPVGHVITQRRKIYSVRHACLTKENVTEMLCGECDTVYYKLRQVLQSAMDLLQIATGITKCDDYYKLRQYIRFL